jgi:hypothetical protein
MAARRRRNGDGCDKERHKGRSNKEEQPAKRPRAPKLEIPNDPDAPERLCTRAPETRPHMHAPPPGGNPLSGNGRTANVIGAISLASQFDAMNFVPSDVFWTHFQASHQAT